MTMQLNMGLSKNLWMEREDKYFEIRKTASRKNSNSEANFDAAAPK
jgi:hypothetical protein